MKLIYVLTIGNQLKSDEWYHETLIGAQGHAEHINQKPINWIEYGTTGFWTSADDNGRHTIAEKILLS